MTPPEAAILMRYADMAERGAWERTREICFAALRPHLKEGVQARDVMSFAWDEEDKKEESPSSRIPTEEELEEVRKWAEQFQIKPE